MNEFYAKFVYAMIAISKFAYEKYILLRYKRLISFRYCIYIMYMSEILSILISYQVFQLIISDIISLNFILRLLLYRKRVNVIDISN